MNMYDLIALALPVSMATAGLTVFEASGLDVDGTPSEFQFFADGGQPIAIEWWVDYEALGTSWGSELIIELEHEQGGIFSFDGADSNFADIGSNDILFGFDDAPGVYQSTGIGIFVPDDYFGTWTVRIFDEFDDFGTDGNLDVRLNVYFPTPGTFAPLALMVILPRRRR